jgi:ankyrin repeat protein
VKKYACQNGHLEALEAFLPFLTDIATVQRALAWSARNKRSKLVKRILLHPGIDVNAKVRGDTALYLACLTADRETILPILEAGGDPTILCGNYGDEFGGVGSMRYIPFGEVKDETKGHTALYALASSGRRGFGANECNPETLHELFHLLVAKGAKIDQRTESDETALHAAVNNPVMLRLLLNAGADANAVNRSGQTVLHRVTLIEAVALLVEEGKVDINKIYPYDGCTPLLTMLSQYNKDVILKLLQYRPDLSIKDKRGNGALHIALAQQNNGADIIQELLAAGADPNERNRAGETPLLVLRMENRDSAAIVDMLLKAGADINAKDASGKTLLSRAVGSQGWARDPVHADITGLLGKGADLHVRDFKGRTVLHHAIEKHEGCERDYRGKKQVTRFDFLLGLGLDVRVVDYRGNTLLHELALRGGATDFHYGAKFIPVWNQLLALGIDVNQGNQQGRTALHMQAAAKGSSYGRESYQSKYFCPIDLVLSKVKDVDQRDHQGLTALHLASTVAVANVKKLLEAGSDPTSASFDALTPLHLAARARHSNIVGLLLSSIKEDRVKAINATDAKGNTPLYYACQSGRPETVQLLLEAGADASKGTLFSACATFEDEQKLWGVDRHAADTEQNQSASGLTIGDTTRPEVPKDNDYRSTGIDDVRDSARLEEIIDMLVSHNCDLSSLLGGGSRFGESGALDQAASAGHTYTFSCLLRARDSIQPASKSRRYFASSALEEATVKAYKDADVAAATDASTHVRTGEANQAHVTRALKRRQYRVLRALFDKGVDFLAQERIRSTMEILVEHGYASLLIEIGHLEAARKLGEGKWHAFGDVGQPGLYTEVSAADVDTTQNILLLSALGRATPNMDVVRLLVEEFHVDVNQRRYSKTYIDGNYEVMPQESALHLLAKGTHWWHTALALPYLISKGADLEARDYNGNTALHIALGIGSDLGSFHREAAKALIAAGANVNTRDNKGHACFAGTVGDAEMFQLFIDAGASISADAVFRAIRSREIGVLKTLLDAGADPNVRLEPDPTLKSGKTVEFVQGEFDLPVHEVYPLYAAAKMYSVSRDNEDSATEKNMDSETAVQLVETLLAAGADPYATFYRKNPGYMDKSSDKDKTALSNPEFEQVVVLHELLVHKHLVHPILSLDTLDPNRRDSRGRSVLHMACHKNCLGSPIDSLVAVPEQDLQSSRPSFLECLRARGADMMAVDSAGSGVLHHILRNRCRLDSERDMATLRDLAKTYPGLLNQTDSSGKTPLHVAIEHAIRYHAIAPAQALLECGADAFAVDGEGNSCLHILAFGVYRSTEIRTLFTQLVGKGLDVNARNNSGETPLFNLNRDGDIQSMHFEKEDVRIDATEALDFFESLGADFFAADDEGKGLLHVAAKETVEIDENDRRLWPWSKEEHTESKPTRFQTLLGKGLDPMMEDKKKRTALDVAAACGKASVLKLYEKDSSDV